MKDTFSKKKLKYFKNYLPCTSTEFESKFRDLIENSEKIFKPFGKKEGLVLERCTKKGFCLNRGCKSQSDCNFIIKYKVC
jgi:hypothetical protein